MPKPTPQSTAERAAERAELAASEASDWLSADADADRKLAAARDAAREVADCWRAGAGGGGDADAAFHSASAWDAIADEFHRAIQHRAEATEIVECLPRRIMGSANHDAALAKRMEEIAAEPRVEWRGQKAFCGDQLVAVMSRGWGGWTLGVWDAETERMRWWHVDTGPDADRRLRDLRAGAALNPIPDDADLFP